MKNRRNVGTNYREFRDLSKKEMGMPNNMWDSKKSSPYEEDAPRVYRNEIAKRALNEAK